MAQKRACQPLSDAVDSMYEEWRVEREKDAIASQERNRGIRYYRRLPRNEWVDRPLCGLSLRVTRQHPLDVAAHQPGSLLVVFSPHADPRQVVRQGMITPLTQLAACSSLGWQLYAKQLCEGNSGYGELTVQSAYYFPTVRVSRDHRQGLFAPLWHAYDVSVLVLRESDALQDVWSQVGRPLALAAGHVRNVIVYPFEASGTVYTQIWRGLQHRYQHTFDHITLCVSDLSTELELQMMRDVVPSKS